MRQLGRCRVAFVTKVTYNTDCGNPFLSTLDMRNKAGSRFQEVIFVVEQD